MGRGGVVLKLKAILAVVNRTLIIATTGECALHSDRGIGVLRRCDIAGVVANAVRADGKPRLMLFIGADGLLESGTVPGETDP